MQKHPERLLRDDNNGASKFLCNVRAVRKTAASAGVLNAFLPSIFRRLQHKFLFYSLHKNVHIAFFVSHIICYPVYTYGHFVA